MKDEDLFRLLRFEFFGDPLFFIERLSTFNLHPSVFILSLSLVQRISTLAVEVAKIFDLNEVKTCAGNASQQVNDLLMGDVLAVRL